MKNTYIIGEIGQNHNGSVDIAKLIIDLVSRPPRDDLFGTVLTPVNAIKLTKRDLKAELAASAMNRVYDSPHAFGRTYGEHRAFLELSNEEHYEIYQYAKSKNLEFVETICAIGCLSLLELFQPDRLKVASRDLTNLPLLDAMASTKIPMILSTGMAGQNELSAALEVISKHHDDISILHCVSQYPTEYQNLNLHSITYLKRRYPQYTIGYSDHSVGIFIPTAAVAMGAEIIEKHITIDRNMKGTDQQGSLGPEGVRRLVRDIRLLEDSLGQEEISISGSVLAAQKKLERSIASIRELKEGQVLTAEDIHLLSPGDGFKWFERDKVLGKKLTKNIEKDEIIYPKYFE